tara:strand:+ start:165 stop:815 length:651 start_codon:yes stop_codon:yes gene_type:complete
LVEISNRELENFNIDLKISKNQSKNGGFKNKYKSISIAKNEFVYQIDSDNIANSKFLKYLENVNFTKLDKKILYIPSGIFLFKKNKYEKYIKPRNNITFLNNSKIITPEFLKQSLIIEDNFVKNKNVNWLLNTGNPFVYKDSYMSFLEKGLKMEEKKLSAGDAIAMVYFWLSSGHNICVASFLKHYHRTRENSYWNVEGKSSYNSTEYFKVQIKNL